MSEKLTQGNQSLAKGLQIAETLAANKGVMRLQDIAKNIDMPISTVARMINTLVEKGYVYQNPETLHYALTNKFSTLSGPVSLDDAIKENGHQILLDLCSEVRESCSLITRTDDNNIIHIDCVEHPENMLAARQWVGMKVPMYATGAGKLLLLEFSDEELDKYIKETTFQAFTKNTITNGEALKEELAAVRKQKWAMDDEEIAIGVRCLAAGITDSTGKIIGGISISGPTLRITSKKIPGLCEIVKKAAGEISKRMGASL